MACAEIEEFQDSGKAKTLDSGTKTYVVVDG